MEKKLNEINIKCEYKASNEWMTYVMWYSLIKMYPDIDVRIFCKMAPSKHQLFRWVDKAKVKFKFFTGNISETNTYDCWHVAVANSGDIGPIEAKSLENAILVDYRVCGNFIMSDWIEQIKNPLYRASFVLKATDMTPNEIKVLKIFDTAYLSWSRH